MVKQIARQVEIPEGVTVSVDGNTRHGEGTERRGLPDALLS